MENQNHMPVLRKVDGIPERGALRKKSKWQDIIRDFIKSDMQAAVVDTNPSDEKDNRRTYNGLMMAIRRNFYDKNVFVIWRHGTIYLVKVGTEK